MSWKSIVGKIAPILGTALGGPMAGTAVKFIADNLLGNPEATVEEIEAGILSASPEQLTKLKELDIQFKLAMKNLEIDVYELEYKDRDSARKLFNTNIWPQITLSALFVSGYFTILWLLLSGSTELPEGNTALFGMIGTIIGVLTAAIPQILNFWFGSSLGSKEKTQKMLGGGK